MKRTCNGCKALNYNNSCDLNYKTEKVQIDFITIGAKPLEECPKPKSNDEYVKLYFNNIKELK